MSKSTLPSQAQILALMRHLADVAALKQNPAAQRQLLVDGLNDLIGTECGFFYVADGWREGANPHFTHMTLTSQTNDTFLRYTAEFGIKFPLENDPYCDHSIRDPSPVGAWTFDDVTARKGPKHYPHFLDLRGTVGHRDGVVTYYRTGRAMNRIVGVGLHRFGKSRPMRRREVALAQLAVEEVRRLVERGHLTLPPLDPDASAELSPRLRQILDRLLVGQSPKAIAFELGLSVWTVREHIQRLYAHFGVRGREELMARFVR